MSDEQPIIIKKVVKGGHGAHGGAWKVAYADFVTAMMAFFLLLWLLNVTTDEQKAGIADHFSPAAASLSRSGSGGIMGGRTMSPEGAKVSDAGVPTVFQSVAPPATTDEDTVEEEEEKEHEQMADGESAEESIEEISRAQLEKELAEQEQQAFEKAVDAIQQAIQDLPELADLSRHILVDMTPEGMRIQLVDQERKSMFPSGSAALQDHTQTLIGMVTQIVERLPNKVKITGHTDATPYRANNGYDNWELSSDRANASRRALLQSGLAPERIAQVTGKADTEPLLPEDPFAASNRRISIVLLRASKAPNEKAE